MSFAASRVLVHKYYQQPSCLVVVSISLKFYNTNLLIFNNIVFHVMCKRRHKRYTKRERGRAEDSYSQLPIKVVAPAFIRHYVQCVDSRWDIVDALTRWTIRMPADTWSTLCGCFFFSDDIFKSNMIKFVFDMIFIKICFYGSDIHYANSGLVNRPKHRYNNLMQILIKVKCDIYQIHITPLNLRIYFLRLHFIVLFIRWHWW